jgi:hypothetical protein
MATTPETPPQERSRQWLDFIAQQRQQTAYCLLFIAALLAIIPVWLGIKYKMDFLWVTIATSLLAVVPLGAGVWYLLRVPGSPIDELAAARMLVLIVGGLFGFFLVVAGVTLIFQWWDVVATGLKGIRESGNWRTWLTLFALLLGGLVLMFVSLQLGREQERTSPAIRRLVYGYNAVLMGLLLVAILVVVNILAYNTFAKPIDWTTQSIYSLSSESENILTHLNKPTKVYVILARQKEETLRKVQALLDNCRAINDRIQVEYLSPDIDRERVNQLNEKYNLSEREGILVVSGTPPNDQSQFITYNALYESSPANFMRSREPSFFKGESELMSALNFLSEGKEKPVIYFTQGNGELDLNDFNREIDRGASSLKRRLEADNYTVKGLRLSPIEGIKEKNPDTVVATKVPDDASIVVVAGPKNPMPDHVIKALRDYMGGAEAKPAEGEKKEAKKDGKMVVLMDVVLTPDRDKMQRIGIEDLLAEYGVQVGNDRVMHIPSTQFPNAIGVPVVPPANSRNPIAVAFQNRPFIFYSCRTVKAGARNPMGPSRFNTEVLLEAPEELYVWAETNLRANPLDLIRRDQVNEIKKKLSQEPLPVAVTVAESSGGPDPHAPFMPPPPGGEQKPRMVVFGDATIACNQFMAEDSNLRTYDLLQSTFGWLRERPGRIGIQPKKQDTYELNAAGVNFGRMIWLPGLLMFVGIVGLGTGVWVVRRR